MVRPIRAALIFGMGYIMGIGGCDYLTQKIREQPAAIEYSQDIADKLKDRTNKIIDDTLSKHLESYKR